MIVPNGKLVTMLHFPNPAENSFDIYQFKVILNSGGGDCLFKALSQARDQAEYRHNIERKQIVSYIVRPENWKKYKTFLIAQHREEIKAFNDKKASDSALRDAYQHYMTSLGSYGTLAELEIASRMKPAFSFTLITRSNTWTNKFASVQVFKTPGATLMYFFYFTGRINAGHWEKLDPLFLEPRRKEIPHGDYVECGSDPANPQSIHYSNRYSKNRPTSSSFMPNFLKSLAAPVNWFRKRKTPSEADPESETELESDESTDELPQKKARFDDSLDPERRSRSRGGTCNYCHKSGPKRRSQSCPNKRSTQPKGILVKRHSLPALSYSFAGSRVLVLGGSGGLACPIIEAFCSDKAHVTVLDDSDELESPVSAIEEEHLSVIPVDCSCGPLKFEDLRRSLDCCEPFDHLVVVTEAKCGKLLGSRGDDGRITANLEVLRGVLSYFATEKSLKGIPCKSERTVVNVCVAEMMSAQRENNPMFKFQNEIVQTFIVRVSEELKKKNVRINCVQVLPQRCNLCSAETQNEPGATMNPERAMASAVLFFSSRLSAFQTGQTIVVDRAQSYPRAKPFSTIDFL